MVIRFSARDRTRLSYVSCIGKSLKRSVKAVTDLVHGCFPGLGKVLIIGTACTQHTLVCFFLTHSKLQTAIQQEVQEDKVRVAQEFGERDRCGLSPFLLLLLSFLSGPLAPLVRQMVIVQHPQKS
ncbi:hypothetical protein MG293_000859 [Ovis ammon polii]|uniref:Uncharacterized protein n=1 Tax=Ovis ammon polii TaxID=230172 RepID=A0AAD4YHH7_OVIAM|nr:hypothetical protein MG293_000859 [Ovis ammon polii]